MDTSNPQFSILLPKSLPVASFQIGTGFASGIFSSVFPPNHVSITVTIRCLHSACLHSSIRSPELYLPWSADHANWTFCTFLYYTFTSSNQKYTLRYVPLWYTRGSHWEQMPLIAGGNKTSSTCMFFRTWNLRRIHLRKTVQRHRDKTVLCYSISAFTWSIACIKAWYTTLNSFILSESVETY